MLPVELLSALKAYAQNQPTLSAGSTGAAVLAPPLQEGQQVPGVVLAQVSEGVFNVRIAGQLIQLNLPTTTQTGETLQLQVVSLQPRLTFGLLSNAATQVSANASQLSDVALLLSTLQQSQPPPTKALIQGTGATPLMVPEGLPSTQELAQALQQTIANSGLFYESHQAQWVGGERSTAQLLQEPQNQGPPGQSSTLTQALATAKVGSDALLTPIPAGVSSAPTLQATGNINGAQASTGALANSGGTTTAVPSAGAGAAPAQPSAGAIPAPAAAKMALYSQTNALGGSSNPMATPAMASGAAPGSPSTTAASGAAATTASAAPAVLAPGQGNAAASSIPAHLQPLVQQQLTALETGRVFWQGQVFPGQTMDWEVWQEQPEHPPTDNPALSKTWNTALRLHLPHLGVVEARMQFAAAGMNLLIQTSTPDSLQVLSGSRASLHGALRDAGIPVTQLRVVQQSA